MMAGGTAGASYAQPEQESLERLLVNAVDYSGNLAQRLEQLLDAVRGPVPRPATETKPHPGPIGLLGGGLAARNNLLRATDLLGQVEQALGIVPR